MADRFFDTSAIVKRYHVEVGSAEVDALLREVGARHFVSELGVVEFHSVFARLVRTRQITPADFTLLQGRFLADIAAGLWQVVPVTAVVFLRAQQQLVRHGLVAGLKTLDSIQLAVAMGLHATAPLAAFVTADANLASVAAAEGLIVVNPELP